jgi:molybdate transport system substrate-binding protein
VKIRVLALGAVAVVAVTVLGACGSGTADTAGPAPRTLTVSAAASLTQTFGALGKQFEAANPGVTVRFSFGGSPDLAQQIVNGAPVDVFAAASDATMKTVTDAGDAADPTRFATNSLQIATAPGNPKGITSFADLTKPGLKVVTCAPKVPCGAAEQKVEKATGITLSPVSQESDVTSVLTKVESGVADAGLVYVTDVKGSGDKVDGVSFPEASNAVTNYPIAVVKNGPQPELATAFMALVAGPTGRKELAAAGFGAP